MRERQSKRIQLRATASEVRALKRLADARGVTVSKLVRELVLVEAKKAAVRS